jgi:hypothetical protein
MAPNGGRWIDYFDIADYPGPFGDMKQAYNRSMGQKEKAMAAKWFIEGKLWNEQGGNEG